MATIEYDPVTDALLDHLQSAGHELTTDRLARLALACLDQAGLDVNAYARVRAMLGGLAGPSVDTLTDDDIRWFIERGPRDTDHWKYHSWAQGDMTSLRLVGRQWVADAICERLAAHDSWRSAWFAHLAGKDVKR